MENKYQTTNQNFYFRPNRTFFLPDDSLQYPDPFVPQNQRIPSTGDYQAAFFHLHQKYDELQR